MNKHTKKDVSVASMTGYGRSTGETGYGRITVEVRSLNHRHLDVTVRAPRGFVHLDPEIRNRVREFVSRGKVEVFVTLEERPPDLFVDAKRALDVARALDEVAGALGEKVRLDHVLSVGEIIQSGEKEPDDEFIFTILATAKKALEKMVVHRHEEGTALAQDLGARMEHLKEITGKVEKLAPQVTKKARENMASFLEDLGLPERLDAQRLEMEVALLAQRADITEEILRLKTHQEAFMESLSGGGVIGRRLDFLLQELQREINTIGSKSGMPEISEQVVNFKTGLEKIREQVQNIE